MTKKQIKDLKQSLQNTLDNAEKFANESVPVIGKYPFMVGYYQSEIKNAIILLSKFS